MKIGRKMVRVFPVELTYFITHLILNQVFIASLKVIQLC